uniref:Bicarbonate transporter-like transmembrane domain-containing protein n=1 Tax=Grammatophora oceanica TaxID=210454 RepID=A0A7S1VPE3_9STRA
MVSPWCSQRLLRAFIVMFGGLAAVSSFSSSYRSLARLKSSNGQASRSSTLMRSPSSLSMTSPTYFFQLPTTTNRKDKRFKWPKKLLEKRRRLRKNGRRGGLKANGTSNSYLEFLDSLSGKKFRSFRWYISQETVNGMNNKTNTDAVIGTALQTLDTIVDKGDTFMSSLATPSIREDIERRSPWYKSDWIDAFKKKRQTIPAIMFLYFACLSPAVSFGTIASEITNGSIGIVEFLLSCGFSGMTYSVLCGQPMAFIAPTGLTLAFISGLFRYCTLKGLPFFPVYSWVGLWTAGFMVALGLGGSSALIRFCTRFTDEVFNGLLSLNFIYEAVSSIKRNFHLADPMNLTMPFVALGMALMTFWSTMTTISFQTSKYLNKKARTMIKDFGPVTIFVLMSLINQHPWFRKFGVPTLSVPEHLQLAGGRNLFVPLNAIPTTIKLLCSLPAILLTSLFFMDQNISVRVVNNPDNKLKKGEAYNLDMVALGLITAATSITGLPWMCGATVQSMNHVRAMTESHFNETTGEVEITEVTESRFTGFAVHAMIAATVGILPLLHFVPIPVVSGVFLFLGRKLMSGNSFLARIRDMMAETNRLPKTHPVHKVGRRKMNIFTMIQVACLIGLWSFKSHPSTTIFFPSMIGLLVLVRSFLLPKFFTEDELEALGDPTPRGRISFR